MSSDFECAVWLYGSHARGDDDALSDVDVFVASDTEISMHDVSRLVPSLPMNASISQYSWDEVAEMADYGSLFLHHLLYEGRVLWEAPNRTGELFKKLSSMGKYKHARRDISGFMAVLSDVSTSVKIGGALSYELAVMGTVLRHSSILGCWLNERPSFGRIEPVYRTVSRYGLPSDIATLFPKLYEYRLYIDGRITRVSEPTQEQAANWLERAIQLVNAVSDDAYDYH